MSYTSHRKEALTSRRCGAVNVQTTLGEASKQANFLTCFRLLLGVVFAVSTSGIAAAADPATATSHIQIVKTASVQAQVEPARVLTTNSENGTDQSIPFCLTSNAPYSLSADNRQQRLLTEASTGKTVNYQASLSDHSIQDNSTACSLNPLSLDISIDQSQWDSVSAGLYAGSLRVMIVIE